MRFPSTETAVAPPGLERSGVACANRPSHLPGRARPPDVGDRPRPPPRGTFPRGQDALDTRHAVLHTSADRPAPRSTRGGPSPPRASELTRATRVRLFGEDPALRGLRDERGVAPRDVPVQPCRTHFPARLRRSRARAARPWRTSESSPGSAACARPSPARRAPRRSGRTSASRSRRGRGADTCLVCRRRRRALLPGCRGSAPHRGKGHLPVCQAKPVQAAPPVVLKMATPPATSSERPEYGTG